MCHDIDGMERQSSKRRWTAAEDAALRRSASVGWPTLRALAADVGRSYYAIRHRASRLGAIRLHRLDPAERAARRPTEIPCRYCGSMFLARGGTRYCGDECRTLARGQCPSCGRPVKDLRCSRCAVDGKRSDWPERATATVGRSKPTSGPHTRHDPARTVPLSPLTPPSPPMAAQRR